MKNYRRILILALPIMGGMLSQNVLDLVDTAMVGSLGSISLAAVGLGAFANFMFSGLIMGVGSGVQTLVARRRGERKVSELATPLNAGLIAVVLIGVPLSLILMQFTDQIFSFLTDDPEVAREGSQYLYVRLAAMAALGATFCFRGYLNAVELTTIYLKVIVTVHILNIAISWILIFGHLGFPPLGSLGAAIGTSLSLVIGTGIYFVLVLGIARDHGFLSRPAGALGFRQLLSISIPGSLQTVFFAGGLLALFWVIGRISVDAVAISNVIVNLMKVAILPGVALGLAAMTLVSEAIGRGQYDEAHRWAWQVVRVAAVVMGLIALPGIVFPEPILAGFLHEDALISQAAVSLRLCGLAVIVDAVGLVLLNALIGASAARTAMVVSIVTQWFIGLPMCYLAATTFDLGLAGVWTFQAIYRLLQALILIYIWKRRRWYELTHDADSNAEKAAT